MAADQAKRARPRPQGERLAGSANGTEGGRWPIVGATLLGLTSVLPTKVTPSSITSLEARISPKTSALVLISILSLATTLPLSLPRTTTVVALTLPLSTAVSPRFRVPSELISPSSFPSKVSSPANLTLPLISTSEFSTFLADPVVFIGCSMSVVRLLFLQSLRVSKGEARGCAKLKVPVRTHKLQRCGRPRTRKVRISKGLKSSRASWPSVGAGPCLVSRELARQAPAMSQNGLETVVEPDRPSVSTRRNTISSSFSARFQVIRFTFVAGTVKNDPSADASGP